MDQKLITFFPGTRRELCLEDWAPKLNNENEKRFRIDFAIPLTGNSLIGVPQFIADGLEAIDKEDSEIPVVPFDTELEGITLQFFATDKTPRTQLLTAVTLRKFTLAKEEKGETHVVLLRFNCTVPGSTQLAKWLYENHGATMWADFERTQAAIPAVDNQLKLSDQPKRNSSDVLSDESSVAASDAVKPEHDAAFRGKGAKEAAAKAGGRARGFTGPTNPSAIV